MATSKVSINGDPIIDISDTTAVAADVVNGKVFYNVMGVRTVGTGAEYFPLTGGELTGPILVKLTDKDFTTAPQAEWTTDIFTLAGDSSATISNTNALMVNRVTQDINNKITITMGARRLVSNTATLNTIGFGLAANGTRTIELSDNAPWITALTTNAVSTWRSALGLGTSGALPITIAQGGTGQTTREASIDALIDIGGNSITTTTNDTVVNWVAKKAGIAWYSTTGQLNNQPSQYGYLINVVTTSSATNAHQLWLAQNDGSLYHRGGNQNGWGSNTWKIILDSANYTSTITPASIGAATSSHNHDSAYVKLSGNSSVAGYLTVRRFIAIDNTGTNTAGVFRVQTDIRAWPFQCYNSAGDSNRASIAVDPANNFYFVEQNPNVAQTSDGAGRENYSLPAPTNTGATAQPYDILTSKSAVTVAQGGTGATSFTSGAALIGNNTGAITTRNILHNTSKTYVGTGTDLITKSTLACWNGAYNSSNASNISYVGIIAGGTWQGTTIAADYIGSHAASTNKFGQGNGSNFGHVKLSDNYTSSAGAASSGIAASSKAVFDAYTACLKCNPTGGFNGTASNITLTGTGYWLLITTHASISELNTIWTVVNGSSAAKVFPIAASKTSSAAISGYTMCGNVGLKITHTSSGATLTGITSDSGNANVWCIKLV